MANNPTKVTTLATIKEKMDALVATGNKAIAAGVLSADTISGFSKLEKEYASLAAKIVYDELMLNANPVMAAITRYSYTVVRHKAKTDNKTGKTIALSLITATRQIDLLGLCKYAELDTDWQYKVESFNRLLCLQTAKELNFTASEIKEVAQKYKLRDKAQKLKAAVSNNELCRALQTAINALLPAENEGESVLKCNNHDVSYLLMCYTSRGREALSIKTANDGIVRRLTMDVCYRIATNKRYTLDYKMVEDVFADEKPKALPKAKADKPAATIAAKAKKPAKTKKAA